MSYNENVDELFYQNDNNDLEEEPLYIMTVELEKGKSESIKIYPESKPEELSYDFCKRFNLDFASLVHLTNQIKSLLQNIPNENNTFQGLDIMNNGIHGNANNTDLNKEKNECIIEVDEEDAQISDPRVISNNNNDISNSLAQEDLNENINDQKKQQQQNEEERNANCNNDNRIKEPLDQNTEQSIKEDENINHPQISEITTHSLFSYEEFYNRFRNKIKSKQNYLSRINNNISSNNKNDNEPNTSTITKENHLNKTISDNKIVSLSENEKRLKDFFQQSKNLDDIYLSHNKNVPSDDNQFSNNLNCNYKKRQEISVLQNNSVFYNKSHTSSINEQNKLNKPMIPYNKITTKSASSQTINRDKKNFGEKLYQSGIEMKEKTNRKILALKQTIEQEKEVENTFQPKTLNRIKQNKNINNTHCINRNNIPYCNRRLINPYLYDKYNNKNNKTNCSYTEMYIDNCQGNTIFQNTIEEKPFGTLSLYDNNNNNNTSSNNLNDVIYNKRKKETFKKIYCMLDKEPNTDNNEYLPTVIYNIIQPVLFEMKNKSKHSQDTIKEKDFINNCMKHFDIISFENKRALLDFNMSIGNKAI